MTPGFPFFLPYSEAQSMKRLLPLAEILLIVAVALLPVLASFPYRINIFLSWEGAYRMAEGQVPFKDFGMPVGYMYWVIPAIFFKIFGTQMITLIKAQAFINILAGLAFRSIFKSIGVDTTIRFLSVLVFTLSYTFFNYWPWYNHTVIVYELIALAFLMKYFFVAQGRIKNLWLALSAVFIFFSFFTKQDGGGLAFLVCFALLFYVAILEKKWMPLLIFVGSFVLTGALMILPITGSNFGYWFNHGQAPHSSRISLTDIIREFFVASQWLKFYLLVIAILLIATIKKWKDFFRNKQLMLFTLLTLGLLAQAAIFQVTSYVPLDNNIFFHSFAFVFILSLLSMLAPIPWERPRTILIGTVGVLLWWSSVYWKYLERFILKPSAETYAYTTHEGYRYARVVNRNTFMIELDTTNIPLNQWRVPALKSFKKILVPGPTADGMERLAKMDLFKNNKNPKVLNMSELTPLAADLPFELEKGPHYPLWYHKGVAMFDWETNNFVDRIQNKHYDLVLYEYIPYLNNFYPYEVREALQSNYRKIDSFPAPRNPSGHSWVEVYVLPK